MTAEFHFLRPLWLLALPILVALVWWVMRSRRQGGAWSRVCDAALLPFVVESRAHAGQRWSGWLLAAAGALAVVAVAGPTWERLPVPVFRGESCLVIALDLSSSMNAEDIKPSRLARAKYKIADILRARKTGQTALLVFARQSFVVTPLTNDAFTLGAQLEALETTIMPSQGSAPATALELADKLLKQAGAPDGHVLLITDGADEDAMDAAMDVARGSMFRLTVLGLGTGNGAPVPDSGGGFLKDASGTLVMSRLDDASLQALANAGRGMYLESRPDDDDVASLTRYLDDALAAHAERQDQLAFSQWQERGPWLLLPLLPLAALAFRRGLLVMLCAAGLATLTPRPVSADWWLNDAQVAERAAQRYHAGDFASAARDFKRDRSARGQYNRGNALARQGEYKDALEAYEKALQLNPEDKDALYNKKLVEDFLKQQQQQQSQQKQQGKPEEDNKESGGQSAGQQSDSAKQSDSKSDPSSKSDASGATPPQDDKNGESSETSGRANREATAKPPQKADDKQDKDSDLDAERKLAARSEAEAEHDQSTEQWLRQIPDDPAGLLRRKFEYQYKQTYGDQPRGGNPW